MKVENILAPVIDPRDAEIARLRSALEWYADEEEWSDAGWFYDVSSPDNRCDYGKRARAALVRP